MPRARACAGLRTSTGRAVQQHLAGVAPHGAADDLHQRGLAGAVLAEHHVDFAGAHVQLDVVQRQHPGEALGDAAHLEDDRAGLVWWRRREAWPEGEYMAA